MNRRNFVKSAAAGAATAATAAAAGKATAVQGAAASPTRVPSPAVHLGRSGPLLVADVSSIRYRNGGAESAIERTFRGIAEGEDILDACVAGVNIPELDPEERGIGYGGLPNADGVVQLDSCLMHGPRRWAGGVAGLEGVKTPSRVAKAVAELTDHHLIVGEGAQAFARSLGFEIHDDLNTEASRALWLEWKRRVDPAHWLDPEERTGGTSGSGNHDAVRRFQEASFAAGLSMVDDGLVDPDSFWGTTSLEALSPDGEICGVTTTSGLSWKIPGRAGDSPILGAGQYVDNDVGAAGSTRTAHGKSRWKDCWRARRETDFPDRDRSPVRSGAGPRLRRQALHDPRQRLGLHAVRQREALPAGVNDVLARGLDVVAGHVEALGDRRRGGSLHFDRPHSPGPEIEHEVDLGAAPRPVVAAPGMGGERAQDVLDDEAFPASADHGVGEQRVVGLDSEESVA